MQENLKIQKNSFLRNKGKSVAILDQDDLQIRDEMDKKWVKAWQKEVFKNTCARAITKRR